MADDNIILGPKAVDQIAQMVREHSRRMKNEQPQRGRWQRQQGGSSHQIWFTISEVYCEDQYDDWHLIVTPTWYTKSCTGSPPGANDDDTIDVYDICNIHGFYSADDLHGTTGRATYFYPLTGDCEPKWILDTLCVTPECA